MVNYRKQPSAKQQETCDGHMSPAHYWIPDLDWTWSLLQISFQGAVLRIRIVLIRIGILVLNFSDTDPDPAYNQTICW